MGETDRDALRVGFEGTIKLEFHGAKVSSDAGLFPYRDIDVTARKVRYYGSWWLEVRPKSLHTAG